MPEGPSRVVLGSLFAALVLAWAFNYVAVRVGLGLAAPLWLAALRAGTGALALLAFRAVRGAGATLDAAGRRDALLLGLPNTAGFFGLWFLAARSVPAGETAVVVYTFPLWVVLLSVPVLGVRPRSVEAVAIASGFVGVALIAHPWSAAPGQETPAAIVELVLAAIAWAFGTVVYKRRFRGSEMRAANLYQMAAGFGTLLVASLLVEPRSVPAPSVGLLAVVLYLGVIGTGVGYSIWFELLDRFRASTLSAYLFLVPVVALGASILLLGERTQPVEALGVAVVLLAIYAVGRAEVVRRRDPDSPGASEPGPGRDSAGNTARRERDGPARSRE